jgi:hypothetical protein
LKRKYLWVILVTWLLYKMELEVVEGSCSSAVQSTAAGGVEPMGCPEGGFIVGCCIIHFWCWSPGHGLCC